jgi:hypothetical protein
MGQGFSQIQCTAPINIVRNLQTEKICKLKCSYQFNYTPTTLSIWNEGMFLCLGVDEVATPPVVYNDDNYNVITAFLVAPGLHTYNGVAPAAELILWHMNTTNTKQIFVCIPIKVSSTTTADCATFFDLIMNQVAQTAPADGQHTVYNNTSLTFNKFVPMTPYHSYTGSSLLWMGILEGKCYKGDDDGSNANWKFPDADYLVFHDDDAITMSPQAMAILKQVIPKPLNITAVDEKLNPGGVFYNPNGPIVQSDGQIYIDCQPTGADGEVLVAARQDSGGLLDNAMLKKLWNFTFMKIIIGGLVMLFIWVIAMKVINGIASNSARMAGGAGAGGSGMKGGMKGEL